MKKMRKKFYRIFYFEWDLMRLNEPKDVSINVAINCIYSAYDIHNRLEMHSRSMTMAMMIEAHTRHDTTRQDARRG